MHNRLGNKGAYAPAESQVSEIPSKPAAKRSHKEVKRELEDNSTSRPTKSQKFTATLGTTKSKNQDNKRKVDEEFIPRPSKMPKLESKSKNRSKKRQVTEALSFRPSKIPKPANKRNLWIEVC